jgi:ribosomal-protein-alanine N-acetyltransferase
MAILQLETSRLLLRPFTANDVDEIHRIWIAPGVRKYLWDDEVISKAQAASVIADSIEHVERDGYGLWAVRLRDEERIIGFCGYWFFHDPPQLELLYGIDTPCWGRGLAAEAARAMIRYGFEELGLTRIQASTDAPNLASVRMMEKCGMMFDRREATNGLDTIYYGIARDSFQPGNTTYELRRIA